MNERIEKVINALKLNNINAVYAKSCAEAREYVSRLLPKGATITAGGSVSLKESGIFDIISSGEYNFLDRNAAGITDEQRLNTYKATIGGDYYFCSANALTEAGELINVDGFANRISAIAFGPNRVIMVVGTNKIVSDIDEGFLRVKRIAAPKNSVRLGLDNPCARLGKCVSLLKSDSAAITDGCRSKTRICRNYLISAMQSNPERITVILVEESLGY